MEGRSLHPAARHTPLRRLACGLAIASVVARVGAEESATECSETQPKVIQLTPLALAKLLDSIDSTALAHETNVGPSRKQLLRDAKTATAKNDHLAAVEAYMDLMEVGHDHTDALVAHLEKLYPMGSSHRLARNATDELRRSMQREMRSGRAERLSEWPPVYLLHDVVTTELANELRAIGLRRRAQWSNHHPLVCFQHDAYSGHPGLKHAWERLSGVAGRGARGCFTQAASRAVADALPMSESVFVYRGQETLLDQLSARAVEERTGLRDSHAHSWQMLSYDAARDGGYAEHTDCSHMAGLHDAESRMATVLIYLSDDFDGGETAFPTLGLEVKPPVGSALVFYSYGRDGWGDQRCNPTTRHRSNPVRRGRKVVLQRWYSFAEQPFLAARPMPNGGPRDGRRPFQPTVSCDYVEGVSVNVSCRWYNAGSVQDVQVRPTDV